MNNNRSDANRVCERLANAGAGACALFLRQADPDGAWPTRTADFIQHAQDVARDGIIGGGEEGAACYALALVCTADPDAICAVAVDHGFSDAGGVTDTLVDSIVGFLTVGLVDGAITPRAAASLLRVIPGVWS